MEIKKPEELPIIPMNYVDAITMGQLADSKELPTIMDSITVLARKGQHRLIIKELKDSSAAELAKLGYHIDTFVSVDGTRFEIKW